MRSASRVLEGEVEGGRRRLAPGVGVEDHREVVLAVGRGVGVGRRLDVGLQDGRHVVDAEVGPHLVVQRRGVAPGEQVEVGGERLDRRAGPVRDGQRRGRRRCRRHDARRQEVVVVVAGRRAWASLRKQTSRLVGTGWTTALAITSIGPVFGSSSSRSTLRRSTSATRSPPPDLGGEAEGVAVDEAEAGDVLEADRRPRSRPAPAPRPPGGDGGAVLGDRQRRRSVGGPVGLDEVARRRRRRGRWAPRR